ncbi:MAG: tetraacyldisaccharide 4'-kinase, partial [Armatimonadetes bacterium]|nr:tetraacyldisaccharide 4'-kinase [Armatimonadota bacterium]
MQEQWERAISSDARGIGARALGLTLRAAVWPYLAGLKMNLAIYDSGLRARTRPALPAVSVGNITLGGTGKTTATRALARALLQRGVTPGIVLRGHARASARGPLLVADRDEIVTGLDEAGDEALMLASTIPGCPV